jgi:hypothetical protein
MGQRSTIEEAARQFGVSPTEIIRRIRHGELQARRVRTAQGVRLVVEIPSDAAVSMDVSPSSKHTAPANAGEVNALRQTIALLREQLYQKEAELEARRGEMQQLLEGHQQEVQQLHVLLLQQAQGRVLPHAGQHPLAHLSAAPSDTAATAAEEATDGATPPVTASGPPAATPAVASGTVGATALIGEVLGILTATAATKYEPLTLQQLASAAGLDVATAWGYCEMFADYLATTNTAGHAPAGPIWAPINAALLRTIHMMYEAGETTEAISGVLDRAHRDKRDIAPVESEHSLADAPGAPAPASEQTAPAQPLTSPGRSWWRLLLRI